MTHKSIELTDLELDVFLADAQLPVLVDLWAPWCAPCRAMSPIIDKLARNTAGHLLVAKLDVEKYPSIMQRFSVRGIPTLLLFNPAQDPVRLVGAQSLAQLNEWLANHHVNISVPTVHVQQDESLEWGSFYGDDELLAFIAARVLLHAREREITTGQSRYWIEGKGTLAAAMVHQPDSNAFERITGLSAALGCLLDRCEYLTVEQVEGLFGALRAGKDYRLVPPAFMQWWLSDGFFPWDNHLRAPELITLLAQWQTLCADRFAGRETTPQAWADIGNLASSLLSGFQTSDRQLEKIVAMLIQHLSPFPVTTDGERWDIITKNMNWAHFHIMQIHSGWSDDDRATPEKRMGWFMAKERQTPTGKLTQGEIAQLRDEWKSLNGEFISKENALHQNLLQLALPISTASQTVLNRLLAAAPDL